MTKLMAVVLAAGQGTRMKSKMNKMLHAVCGKPMAGHVLDTLKQARIGRVVAVIGHGAESVRNYLGDAVEYAVQKEQLGTGHAVLEAQGLLAGEEGTTVVICGDTPLIRPETLSEMIRIHQEKGAAASILTAVLADPKGYGRIIRGDGGQVTGIVEQKDCTPEQHLVKEINTGTYCFDNKKLFAALRQVTNNNAQNEYYLTDVIGILNRAGETVLGHITEDDSEWLGVNDRAALAEANRCMRQRINKRHMAAGVTLIDPDNTYIEPDVVIGSDTMIYPGTVLKGSTVIGSDCVIGPQADIDSSRIGEGVTVKHSVLLEAQVDDEASVGPFAYLRPGAVIGRGVKIGDFVEVKNATLGEGTKVSHLSYVGDAKVGRNVNIGCGAITVNYDGFNKQLTEIEDDAFIGSNVNLIAPVKIGKGAYVVAGSTITHEVGENDLAIARERQTNKPGYAEKLKARFRAKKQGKTE